MDGLMGTGSEKGEEIPTFLLRKRKYHVMTKWRCKQNSSTSPRKSVDDSERAGRSLDRHGTNTYSTWYLAIVDSTVVDLSPYPRAPRRLRGQRAMYDNAGQPDSRRGF